MDDPLTMDHLDHLVEMFTPHGHCMLWTPGLVGLHAVSDGFIALAYLMIPIMLAWLATKRRDLPYSPVFWLFAAFIILCGTTHLMALWNMWHTAYWLEGVLKVITAFVSVGTAFILIQILPHALKVKSVKEVEAINAALKNALVSLEYEATSPLVPVRQQSIDQLRETVSKIRKFAGSTEEPEKP